MKRKAKITSGIAALAIVGTVAGIALAQNDEPLPSPKASVMQVIGTEEARIVYHRPGVKGREGEIWGGLEEWGEYWRAGANPTTLFEFDMDVRVNGQELSAGEYGFFILLKEDEPWELVFTSPYNPRAVYPGDDKVAARLVVEPQEVPFKERLVYGFEDMTDNSAICYMHWENKRVEFKITLD